ncbi:MAG: hypothetical protein ABIW79_10595, partial [Gemmatimonas sp.]
TGKRSPDDARKMYGEQIMAMKAGQPAPYTERLLFTPAMGMTNDPDHPFFMATLFMPERASRPSAPHPLIIEYLRASMARAVS